MNKYTCKHTDSAMLRSQGKAGENRVVGRVVGLGSAGGGGVLRWGWIREQSLDRGYWQRPEELGRDTNVFVKEGHKEAVWLV